MATKRTRELTDAKLNRRDEFYTRYEDIANVMAGHMNDFRGMNVYCPCDDPYRSMFVRWLLDHYARLGLNRLDATCLGTPRFRQTSLFGGPEAEPEPSWHLSVTRMPADWDGSIDTLARLDGNRLEPLEDGDFRGVEARPLWERADAIVTNPPFSLFSEFVMQTLRYGKKCLILGPLTAVAYRRVLPAILDGRLWLDASVHAGGMRFHLPDGYESYGTDAGHDGEGRYVAVKGIRWFVSGLGCHRPVPLPEPKPYGGHEGEWRRYDNADALDAPSLDMIPDAGYAGVVGVPITFLDRWDPDEWEMLGLGDDLTIDGRYVFARLLVRRRC